MSRRRSSMRPHGNRHQPTRDTFRPGPAPPPPGPQPLPFDAAYESQVGANQAQYDVTNAGLQYQEGRTRQEYGFDDLSDPFNRAAMLERNYRQSQSGNLNSMAAGGQLYSGATQRQQDEGTYQYNRNRHGLQNEYQDRLQGYAQQRAQAGADRASGNAAAFGSRIDRASNL